MEPPECPVCLQTFNPDDTVPRVLSCGHSTCESCLYGLSSTVVSPFPDTIRCPSCTQIVRFPRALGPSSLPKNIDLLRLCSPCAPGPKPRRSPICIDSNPVPGVASGWKRWILPRDAILKETVTELEGEIVARTSAVASSASASSGWGLWFEADREVSLLPIGDCEMDSDNENVKGIQLSYVGQIMKVLGRLGEKTSDELLLVLEACSRQRYGICKFYGLWMNVEGGSSHLYLACERFQTGLSDFLTERDKNGASASKEELFVLALIGMEMCEAVMGLHSRGILCGGLYASCFRFDGHGHCVLDINNLLLMGKGICKSGRSSTDCGAVVSPAVFALLCDKHAGLRYEFELGYESDAWSLACILAEVFLGNLTLNEELWESCFKKDNFESCVDLYDIWMDNVLSRLRALLIDTCFESLLQTIKSCLNFDRDSRPQVSDLWKCIRSLLVNPRKNIFGNVDVSTLKKKPTFCLLLCDFSSARKLETGLLEKKHGGLLQESEPAQLASSVISSLEMNGMDVGQTQQEKANCNVIKGMHDGALKYETLQSHIDCITGLAIGGGFLVSSSYDKMVHVWSLQDFSHVQSLMGHKQRVMAVVVVESSEILCISGDSGGFISVWAIGASNEQAPLKQWREHDDWRYSGIHALAVLGSQYLYSGGGDKSIKAWSLKDFSLACIMSGHTSTVSSLVVSNGILYSGSWDGTVRLWWLDDHSPLAVLGNDTPGSGFSVLSLAVSGCFLAASYETGFVKIWKNDVLMKSTQIENGAIFALQMDANWLFTGGWDKNIKVQELLENESQMDIELVGSIASDSAVTALLYRQGKLFVGSSNKDIKVYCHESSG